MENHPAPAHAMRHRRSLNINSPKVLIGPDLFIVTS